MATSRIEYLGGLQTKYAQIKSETEILTDVPTDTYGKEKCFRVVEACLVAKSGSE